MAESEAGDPTELRRVEGKGDSPEKTMDSASIFTRSEVREEELDSTGKLPNEVVVMVLSCLTFKEAIRTSVLSTRWRDLWKTSDLVLNFDASDELFVIYKTSSQGMMPLMAEKRWWYKNWVNGVVRQLQEHNALKLKQFRVVFNLTNQCNSEGDIDKWVRFAVSKRVDSLDLNFDVSGVGNAKLYVFSEDCYNHFKTPAGMSDIKSLRSLRLSCVEVRGEIIEHFISNCPLLEDLAVQQSNALKQLRVVGSSLSPLRLKYLELRYCWYLESLEIDHAPDLVRLIYDDCHRVEDLQVGNCPNLVDVTLGFGHCQYDVVFKALSGCAIQLESLLLKTFAMGNLLHGVAEHTRLEQLTVEVMGGRNGSLVELVPLINACPRLHTLQVFLHTDSSDENRPQVVDVVKMHRESIKVVEIVGFRGFEMDCELVEYVMQYFVELERIVVDRSAGTPSFCDNSIFGSTLSKLCSKEEADEAKMLALGYKSRAPPNIDFIVI